MSEILRITPSQTEQLLREKYGDRQYEVQQLGEGAWSYAYSFVHDGAKKVIRWGGVSDNFGRDAYAAKLSSHDLPIPSILEIGESMGMYYAISPFVTGGFVEKMTPQDLKTCTPSIFRMFRALRSTDITRTQGYGFFDKSGRGGHDSWKSFLLDDKNESAGSLIHGWKTNLEGSALGTASYDRLWGRFKSYIDFCPEERKLVHSDLINRNVLTNKSEVTAVLDWGSSFIGDPLYDIAWLLFYEPWFPNFTSANLIQGLMEDFAIDPNANTVNTDKRLLCYQLNIASGSIAYNAFRRDWKSTQEVINYSTKLLA